MADKTLAITLKADDQVTGTFKKVGDAGKQMGEEIEQGAKKAGESTKSLSADIKAMEGDLRTAGLSLTAFGAANMAFYTVATDRSMEFTTAMSNVQSIARVSESELAALRDTVLDLSIAYAGVPTDLADGLYDIIGSGFEAADAVMVLESAVVAAGAGLTDTATAATAITAVLNAYQMSASEAGNVSDILFKVVDSGVISFEALSGSMGRTLPLAASLGVRLDELGAAYAALTLVGIGPSEAETGIAAIMTAAIGPTEALTAAVQEYGYESAEALIAAEGFAGFLEFLQRTAGGSTTAMSELMGNVRATNAALALGTNDGRVYAQMLDDMGGAAQDGAYTLEVFGIQMDNAAGSVAFLKAEISAATIAIGSSLEPLVGWGADAIAGIVGGFNDLSPAAQGAATAFGVVTSGAALFTGAAMLAIPQLVSLYDAIRRIRTVAAGAALFGPWGLAIAGVSAALAIGAGAWMNHRREVEEAEAAYASVGAIALEVQDTIANFQLGGGDLGLAAQMDQINSFTAVTLESFQMINEMELDWERILNIAYKSGTSNAGDEVRAFLDGSIGQAFIKWAEENERLGPDIIEMLMSGTGPELFQLVAELQPLMEEFYALFDIPPEMHQRVSENTQALIDMMLMPLVDSEQVFADWAAARDEFLSDPLNPDMAGYDAWLQNYIRDLPAITAEANATSDAFANLIANSPAEMMEFATKASANYEEVLGRMNEGHKNFLGDGTNILDWWREYDGILNAGAAALDGTAAQLARIEAADAFRGMVDWAGDMNDASRALDQALRTFQQIDDLGSRSSAAGSIAENLVGEPGVWHEIDELLQSGKISIEQYNEAVAAGHEIQWSNMRVQEQLNEIRRNQLPMLAEEQAAYEENIAYLSTLSAAEQRRALMLQDSSVQAEIATAYNLAYSASLGEIPEEVATEMLVNTAQADPALASILVQMGLLKEVVGEDGQMTYEVNFPDAETTISAINRLTIAMIELEAMNQNMSGFELAIEIYGEEEAMDLYNMVKNADGTYSTVSIEAEDNATPVINEATDNLRSVDEMSATFQIDADASSAYTAIDNIASYNGRVVATAYMAIQPINYTGNDGIGWTQAHGGTVGEYATGGVVFRAGEIGMEMAHFANGGTALIPRDGYYQAPAGTYISPNNAVAGNTYGGISIDFSGAVFHNTSRDEMNAWAREDFLPLMREETRDLKVGMGVGS